MYPIKGIASSLVSHNDYDREPITLNDVLVGNLSPQLFNGTWVKDTILFYDEDSNLCTLDVNPLQKQILVTKEKVVSIFIVYVY